MQFLTTFMKEDNPAKNTCRNCNSSSKGSHVHMYSLSFFFCQWQKHVYTGTWLAWKWKTLVAPETPYITLLLDLQGVFISGKNCKSYENTVKVQNLSPPSDFPRAIQLDILDSLLGCFCPLGLMFIPLLYIVQMLAYLSYHRARCVISFIYLYIYVLLVSVLAFLKYFLWMEGICQRQDIGKSVQVL